MPRPRRRKEESENEYRQKLIKHYIDEGYSPKQAVAIAYDVIRREKEKKKKRS